MRARRRFEPALHRVLARGGVVAGTSAGASILTSYLVRGAPEGNWILSAPGHERGFGLLANAAVDQHVDRYHREDDIADVSSACTRICKALDWTNRPPPLSSMAHVR